MMNYKLSCDASKKGSLYEITFLEAIMKPADSKSANLTRIFIAIFVHFFENYRFNLMLSTLQPKMYQ